MDQILLYSSALHERATAQAEEHPRGSRVTTPNKTSSSMDAGIGGIQRSIDHLALFKER